MARKKKRFTVDSRKNATVSIKAESAGTQKPAGKPASAPRKTTIMEPAKVKPATSQKPAGKPASAPRKTTIMEPARTKEEIRSEFEETWEEYNHALDNWKDALAWWYDTTNKTLVTYRAAYQRALETDAEVLKRISASWQNTWEVIGPTYIRQQTSMIENIFGNTNIKTINKFNEQWEKFLKTSSSDSITVYQEAIKKFNQALVVC